MYSEKVYEYHILEDFHFIRQGFNVVMAYHSVDLYFGKVYEYHSLDDFHFTKYMFNVLMAYHFIALFMVMKCCHSEEQHVLQVFENKVFRKIFGPKREVRMGKLYNFVNYMLIILSGYVMIDMLWHIVICWECNSGGVFKCVQDCCAGTSWNVNTGKVEIQKAV
jgi:hypothetical protein